MLSWYENEALEAATHNTIDFAAPGEVQLILKLVDAPCDSALRLPLRGCKFSLLGNLSKLVKVCKSRGEPIRGVLFGF